MTRRDLTIVVAGLVAIVIVAYIAPLVGGATFVGRDHLTHTIPAKQFLADSLAAGRLPQWWPAVDLGAPFAANPNHSALYPVAWLVAILPMPWGADVLLVLHILFSGLGMAALARRLGANTTGCVVAGAAFMLSGFATSTVVHGGPALTLAWTPWIAWATCRLATSLEGDRLEPTLHLAAFVAAQLLAGDPSFAIASGLLSCGVAACLAKRRVPALGLVVAAYAGAVVLAAVVVVPALYLWRESARAGGITGDVATVWSMHPLRVLEMLWPNALGDPNQANEHLARVLADSSSPLHLSPSWALSVYVSIPVIGGAVVGALGAERSHRRLAWLVVIFALLALGRYTPLYDAFRAVFLPERIVRYPEKYFIGILVVTCAFAGLGASRIAALEVPKRTAVIGSAVVLSLLVVVGIGTAALPALVSQSDASNLAPALDVDAGIQVAQRAALAGIAVTIAALGALYFARRHRWLVQIAAVVLIGHLIGRTWETLPTFDRTILGHRPRVLGEVTPGRLARPDEHLTRPGDSLAAQAHTLYEGAAPNVATRFGFTYLVGYDQGHGGAFDAQRDALVRGGDAVRDRYGVELEIVPRDELAGRTPLGSDESYGPYALVRNDGARPRAFTTSRWVWSEAPGLPTTPLEVITLHGRGEAHAGTSPLAPCTVHSSRPEEVDVTCDAAGDAYAVLLDAWAAGWSATVDGKQATIERADDLVRAVRVSGGHHVIAFRFASPGLHVGALVSLVAWLGLVAMLVIPGLIRRRARTS